MRARSTPNPTSRPGRVRVRVRVRVKVRVSVSVSVRVRVGLAQLHAWIAASLSATYWPCAARFSAARFALFSLSSA